MDKIRGKGVAKTSFPGIMWPFAIIRGIIAIGCVGNPQTLEGISPGDLSQGSPDSSQQPRISFLTSPLKLA
jgi:hypothetical protein